MSDGRDLWENPEAGFSVTQATRIQGFRAWLRRSELDIAKVLADPANFATPFWCSAAEMERLERSILDERASLSSAHLDSLILGKAVAYLNVIGAALPQPRTSNIFHLPANPFREEITAQLHRVHAWLEAKSGWIHECGGTPPVELVVFSAILHGGLWHKTSVLQFTRSLFAPDQSFGHTDTHPFLNMSLPWNGKPDMEKRFWRIDTQTAFLLRQPREYANAMEYLDSSGQVLQAWTDEKLATRLFRRIVARMRQTGIEQELRPKNLAALLKAVALCAQTELPAVLVSYAARTIVSHSLKPESLSRIYKQLPNGQSMDGVTGLGDEAELNSSPDLDSNQEGLESPGLHKLRTALRTDAEARLRLNELLEGADSSSVWFLITAFAHYLLERRHMHQRGINKRKSLGFGTAKAYALTVGRRLGSMLGGQSPLQLDTQTLETIYTQVLENVNEGSNPQRLRRAVALVLREFHEFLVLEHDAEAINEWEVLGIDRGLLPVDANIITLEEYFEARRIIRWELHAKYDERLRNIADAMLILGFRCGTRRMEARDLQIADFIDHGPAWLLIRPWQERGLKTANSIRQLPLHALMPKDELAVLSRLKRHRERQAVGDNDPYLFGVPEVAPVRVLMRIMHDALRAATGDTKVHYHHLRHSFATFTFLRLMLSDLPEVPDLFPRLPETTAWLRNSRRFRVLLYSYGRPTRQHALTVASLLGHSGPKVTFEHYVHCLDWLLPLFLENSTLLAPSIKDIAAASTLSPSTVYELRAKFGARSQWVTRG
jgi:integrase